MNKVKNKAKEIITVFGGVELVAKALRVKENTTTKRVNDVIITKILGAIDNIVISIITLKIRAVVDPVVACSTFKEIDWAIATSTKQKEHNMIKAIKNFLDIFTNFLCFQ